MGVGNSIRYGFLFDVRYSQGKWLVFFDTKDERRPPTRTLLDRRATGSDVIRHGWDINTTLMPTQRRGINRTPHRAFDCRYFSFFDSLIPPPSPNFFSPSYLPLFLHNSRSTFSSLDIIRSRQFILPALRIIDSDFIHENCVSLSRFSGIFELSFFSSSSLTNAYFSYLTWNLRLYPSILNCIIIEETETVTPPQAQNINPHRLHPYVYHIISKLQHHVAQMIFLAASFQDDSSYRRAAYNRPVATTGACVSL